jgi:hypothetical protein
MTENLDPLSQDVGSKELTKYPLLKGDRVYRFEIRKPSKTKTQDGSKDMLVLPCATVEDYQAVDGETLNKGFTLIHRITVTPSDKRTVKQISADVGSICQATGVKGLTVRQLIDDPSVLDGKVFDAKVKIQPEKDGYPESNSLRPVPLEG